MPTSHKESSPSPSPSATLLATPKEQVEKLIEHTGASEITTAVLTPQGSGIVLPDGVLVTVLPEGEFTSKEDAGNDEEEDPALRMEPFEPADALVDYDAAVEKLDVDVDELGFANLIVWRQPASGMTTVHASSGDVVLQAPSLEPIPQYGWQTGDDAVPVAKELFTEFCKSPARAYITDTAIGCDDGTYDYWGDELRPFHRVRSSISADKPEVERIPDVATFYEGAPVARATALEKYPDATHVATEVRGITADIIILSVDVGDDESHTATCDLDGTNCEWSS